MNIANRLTIARIVMIPVFLLMMCFPKDALGTVNVLQSNLSVSWVLAMLIFTIEKFVHSPILQKSERVFSNQDYLSYIDSPEKDTFFFEVVMLDDDG